METNVFIEYNEEEVLIGKVSEIQALAGPESNEVAQTFNGKAVLFLLNQVVCDVIEELLYNSSESEEKQVIIRIR